MATVVEALHEIERTPRAVRVGVRVCPAFDRLAAWFQVPRSKVALPRRIGYSIFRIVVFQRSNTYLLREADPSHQALEARVVM